MSKREPRQVLAVPRRRPLMLALEPRLMFDGAAVVTAAHAAPDAAAKALIPVVPAPVEVRAADPAKDNGKTEVAFVDTSVTNYKTLEAGIRDGVAIVEIDGGQSGLAQMAQWAESQSGIDAIHVFSHGQEGTLFLGTDTVTDATLATPVAQAELAEIGHALKAGGDLLVYGCDVAAGADGQQFITDLAADTGANVAASTDVTGAASLGGDWVLERSVGSVQTESIDVAQYADTLTATVFTFEYADGALGGVDYTSKDATFDLTGPPSYRIKVDATAGNLIDLVNNTTPGLMNPSDGQNGIYLLGGGSGESTTTISLTDTTAHTTQYLFSMGSIDIFNDQFNSQTYVFAADTGYTKTVTVAGNTTQTVSFSGTGTANVSYFTIKCTSSFDGTSGNQGLYTAVIDNVTVDNIHVPGPTLSTINRSGGTVLTNSTTENFTATFSQAVSGVAARDFTLTGAADTGASIGTPTTSDGGTTWTIPVTTLSTAAGTLGLDLNSNGQTDITAVSNGGALTTASHTGDQTYTVDNAAPTAGTPTISDTTSAGRYTVGDFLSAATGSWTQNAAAQTLSYSYQWQASTDGGGTYSDISGATSSTFTLTSAQAHDTIRVKVTGGDGTQPTAAATSAGQLVADTAPSNSVSPSVTGVAVVGGTLTAGNGTWSDADGDSRTYTYQWERATSSGGAGAANISGATNSTYVLAAGDAHNYVAVIVTADDGHGKTTSQASAWTAVTDSAPVNSVAPGVSGSYVVGNQLTGSAGTWTDADSDTISYTYQWKTATSGGGAGAANISGATTSTYTLQAGDSGNYVALFVTADDGHGGTPTASTAWTQVVTGPSVSSINRAGGSAVINASSAGFTVTFSQAVQGVAASDFALTGTDSAGVSIGTPTTSDGGITWTVPVSGISGAGTLGLTLVAGADDGSGGAAAVTSVSGGNALVGGAYTAGQAYTVDDTAPGKTVVPAVTDTTSSGRFTVGDTFSSNNGTWTQNAAAQTLNYSYQWYYSTTNLGSVSAGTAIAGATSATYAPSNTYAHGYLGVVVTAGDGVQPTATASSTWTLVADSAPANAGGGALPAISGTARVGSTLTASSGTWTDADGDSLAYAYQWKTATDALGTGATNIAGATGSTYTASSGDGDQYVQVVVTAADGHGGTTSQASAWTYVSPPPAITAATYDAATGALVVTGTHLTTTATDFDPTKLTLKGDGGTTYSLQATGTGALSAMSSTSFTLTLSAADKLAVNGLLNKNGTQAADLATTYNLSATGGWDTGIAAAVTTAAVTESNYTAPAITSATSDWAAYTLTVAGTNIVNHGGSNAIDPTKLTVTVEGGVTYTLTGGTVSGVGATGFTVTLNAADQVALAPLVNKNGLSSTGGATYNLATAANWDTDASSAIATTAVNVSNVPTPTVTTATYDYSTGTLVVTGSHLMQRAGAGNDIDPTKLTLTGGRGGTCVLTSPGVEIASATSFTLTLSAADKAAVNLLLNANGLTSGSGTTYNLAAATGWDAGYSAADTVTTAAVTVSSVPAPAAVVVPPPPPPPPPPPIIEPPPPPSHPPGDGSGLHTIIHADPPPTLAITPVLGVAPLVPLAPVLSAPNDGGFRVAVVAGAGQSGPDSVVVAKPIGTVDVSEGRVSFTVPVDAFAVTRADASVTLSATQADGRPLPSWLTFNARSGTFVGTPPPGEKVVSIKVVARDNSGHEAAQVFKINVENTGGNQRSGDAAPHGWGGRFAQAGRPGLAAQLHAARHAGPARMAAMIQAARMAGRV